MVDPERQADLEEVKTWLRNRLDAEGLKQTHLAEALGVQLKTVQNMLSNRKGLGQGLNLYRALKLLEGVALTEASKPPLKAQIDKIDMKLSKLLSPEQLADVERALEVTRDPPPEEQSAQQSP